MDAITHEELRADVFRSLSTLFQFAPPVSAKNEGLLHTLATALDRLPGHSGETARELWNILSACDYQEYAVEFTRLFIGPFETVAPPYGSFYLENRLLMGKTTIEVMNVYLNTGLEENPEFKDLPDHISAELEFVYYLLFNEIRFLKEGALESAREVNTVAEDFLNRYLLPWIEPFAGRFREGTEHAYFKNLADCLTQFARNCTYDLSKVYIQAA